jgi:hypothetical protein
MSANVHYCYNRSILKPLSTIYIATANNKNMNQSTTCHSPTKNLVNSTGKSTEETPAKETEKKRSDLAARPNRNLPWPTSKVLLERSRKLVDHQRLFVSLCHMLHSLERRDKVLHTRALKVIQQATAIRQKYGQEKALQHVQRELSDSVMGDDALAKPSKQDKTFLLFAPILMHYLRHCSANKSLYETCRGVVYVCTEKHKAKEVGFENLASSTMRHLRATVGETLWKQAVEHYSSQQARGVTTKPNAALNGR